MKPDPLPKGFVKLRYRYAFPKDARLSPLVLESMVKPFPCPSVPYPHLRGVMSGDGLRIRRWIESDVNFRLYLGIENRKHGDLLRKAIERLDFLTNLLAIIPTLGLGIGADGETH